MVKDLHPELRALLERFKKDGLTRREIKRLIKKIENLEKTLLEPENIWNFRGNSIKNSRNKT